MSTDCRHEVGEKFQHFAQVGVFIQSVAALSARGSFPVEAADVGAHIGRRSESFLRYC